MNHLYDAKHDYYCNLGNYFNNSCGDSYKSWQGFYEEYHDADFNMNLVFRWDWYEGTDYGALEYNGDDNYRNGLLHIFWMGQRKGLYRYSTVEVCRADEPAVIEFLKPRLEHLKALWLPFE